MEVSMTVEELDRAIATNEKIREGLIKECESAKAEFLSVADQSVPSGSRTT